MPVQAHDSAFSEEAFLSFARAVWTLVCRACGTRDFQPVRLVLAPAYLAHLAAACQDPQSPGITITSTYLLRAETRGGSDSAAVRIHYARDAAMWVVDATFERPATATSRAEDQRLCPICGAPLSLDPDGACRYCGLAVAGGLGGWQLAAEADHWTADQPPSPGSPVDAPIEAHDPAFDEQRFVAYAVDASVRVLRAETAERLDEVRRLLAPAYFEELRAAEQQPAYPEMRILAARLERAGTHAGWDTAMVRVTACHDVPRPPYSWLFDATFQRPAAASSAVGDQPECPVCGAPVSLDGQGACRYCGAPVLGGMGGWLLAQIDWSVTAFPVGRWFHWGLSAEQVDALLRQHQARPTQVRVEDASVPTFAVSMVENVGAYASAYWWFHDYDEASLERVLAQGWRLVSIDPYQGPTGLRFAGVTVPNAGRQHRKWSWHPLVEEQWLKDRDLTGNQLVALRPYMVAGRRVFAAVQDHGPRGGWCPVWNATPEFVQGQAGDQQRVSCLAREPSGRWAAVVVDRAGGSLASQEWWPRGWWGYDLEPEEILRRLDAHGSQLIDVSSYLDGDVRRYAIVELDGRGASLP